jgi:parvulin-like peptidyl-prolyl isomerase
VSEIFRHGEDYYVYKVLAKQAAAVPSFEEARADVERDVLRQKAGQRAVGAARLLLAELRRGEKPEAQAARAKAELRESAYFSRREFVSEAGLKGDLFQDAFALEAGSWGGPLQAPDGRVVLYRVNGTFPASRAEFALAKDEIVKRLRAEKKELLFEAWMADLRRARAVKINDALVGEL